MKNENTTGKSSNKIDLPKSGNKSKEPLELSNNKSKDVIKSKSDKRSASVMMPKNSKQEKKDDKENLTPRKGSNAISKDLESNKKHLDNLNSNQMKHLFKKFGLEKKLITFLFKKKKSNKLHALFSKTNDRFFSFDFENLTFGYKSIHSSSTPYKYSEGFDKIEFFKNNVDFEDRSISNFGFQIKMTTGRLFILFATNQTDYKLVIEKLEIILGINTTVPISSSVFNFATKLGEKAIEAKVKEKRRIEAEQLRLEKLKKLKEEEEKAELNKKIEEEKQKQIREEEKRIQELEKNKNVVLSEEVERLKDEANSKIGISFNAKKSTYDIYGEDLDDIVKEADHTINTNTSAVKIEQAKQAVLTHDMSFSKPFVAEASFHSKKEDSNSLNELGDDDLKVEPLKIPTKGKELNFKEDLNNWDLYDSNGNVIPDDELAKHNPTAYQELVKIKGFKHDVSKKLISQESKHLSNNSEFQQISNVNNSAISKASQNNKPPTEVKVKPTMINNFDFNSNLNNSMNLEESIIKSHNDYRDFINLNDSFDENIGNPLKQSILMNEKEKEKYLTNNNALEDDNFTSNYLNGNNNLTSNSVLPVNKSTVYIDANVFDEETIGTKVTKSSLLGEINDIQQTYKKSKVKIDDKVNNTITHITKTSPNEININYFELQQNSKATKFGKELSGSRRNLSTYINTDNENNTLSNENTTTINYKKQNTLNTISRENIVNESSKNEVCSNVIEQNTSSVTTPENNNKYVKKVMNNSKILAKKESKENKEIKNINSNAKVFIPKPSKPELIQNKAQPQIIMTTSINKTEENLPSNTKSNQKSVNKNEFDFQKTHSNNTIKNNYKELNESITSDCAKFILDMNEEEEKIKTKNKIKLKFSSNTSLKKIDTNKNIELNKIVIENDKKAEKNDNKIIDQANAVEFNFNTSNSVKNDTKEISNTKTQTQQLNSEKEKLNQDKIKHEALDDALNKEKEKKLSQLFDRKKPPINKPDITGSNQKNKLNKNNLTFNRSILEKSIFSDNEEDEFNKVLNKQMNMSSIINSSFHSPEIQTIKKKIENCSNKNQISVGNFENDISKEFDFSSPDPSTNKQITNKNMLKNEVDSKNNQTNANLISEIIITENNENTYDESILKDSKKINTKKEDLFTFDYTEDEIKSNEFFKMKKKKETGIISVKTSNNDEISLPNLNLTNKPSQKSKPIRSLLEMQLEKINKSKVENNNYIHSNSMSAIKIDKIEEDWGNLIPINENNQSTGTNSKLDINQNSNSSSNKLKSEVYLSKEVKSENKPNNKIKTTEKDYNVKNVKDPEIISKNKPEKENFEYMDVPVFDFQNKPKIWAKKEIKMPALNELSSINQNNRSQSEIVNNNNQDFFYDKNDLKVSQSSKNIIINDDFLLMNGDNDSLVDKISEHINSKEKLNNNSDSNDSKSIDFEFQDSFKNKDGLFSNIDPQTSKVNLNETLKSLNYNDKNNAISNSIADINRSITSERLRMYSNIHYKDDKSKYNTPNFVNDMEVKHDDSIDDRQMEVSIKNNSLLQELTEDW